MQSNQMMEKPLPEGWRWVKLGNVCEIIAGQSPASETYRKKPEGLPFFQGKADFGERYPIPRIWCTKPIKFAEPKDILISVRTPVGPTNLADQLSCIGRGLAAIRCHQKIDTEYLLLWLKLIEPQLALLGSGSTFSAINRSDLEAIKIPLPLLQEQQRIAACLREQMQDVEEARQAAETQLKAAEQLQGAYLREVFESTESKLWPKKIIDDFAETCSGSTPSRSISDYYYNGEIPWIKTGELHDEYIESTEEYITSLALKECSLKLLPIGTLLIAMYGQGQTRGRTGITKVQATTNQACFCILPDKEAFNTEYLQQWFIYSYHRIRQETESRGGNQPNLNGIFLRKLVVPLPNIDKQNSIVIELERTRIAKKIKSIIKDQLSAINQLPAALLRQAFSGAL
jgi:type I restriction enzyme S subunit